jgi:hypothetical protein
MMTLCGLPAVARRSAKARAGERGARGDRPGRGHVEHLADVSSATPQGLLGLGVVSRGTYC